MATTLVLLRHGKADVTIGDDFNHPLSAEGRLAETQIATLLLKKGLRPHRILTSPLLRAVQSAEIVASLFHLSYEKEEALGTHFDREVLLALIPSPQENKTLFFVGHEPHFSLFADDLLGELFFKEGIKKSSAVMLSFEKKVDWGKAHLVNYYHL